MKPQARLLKRIAKKVLILLVLIAVLSDLFGPTAYANGVIPAEIWLTFDYKTALPLRQAGTMSLLMNAASFFFCLVAVGV